MYHKQYQTYVIHIGFHYVFQLLFFILVFVFHIESTLGKLLNDKGYNNMSWEWIEKVRQAANLPEGLVRAALRLVREPSEVVFVFDRLDVQPSCFGKSSRAGLPTELRSVHPCS